MSNVTSGSFLQGAQLEVTGSANVGSLLSESTITGNLFVGSAANLTNIPAANISGTISANVVGANLANYANVAFSVAASNVVGTVATANVVTDAEQPAITLVGTLANLTVTGVTSLGNVTIGNLTVTGNTTSANVEDLNVANLSIVAGANSTQASANSGGLYIGNAIGEGNCWAGWYYSYATNAWQSTIGIRSDNANVVNLTATGNVALGSIANVHVTGGSNGQMMTTDGSGNLSWSNVSVPAANVVGTVATANTVTTNAQPNITSLGSLISLTVTGDASVGGNLTVTGDVDVSGNITNATWTGDVIGITYGGTGSSTATGTGNVVLQSSPTLTGTPLAPTAANGTSNTQLATTAFVAAAITNIPPNIPSGTIMLFAQDTAPTGWTKLVTVDNTALRVVSGTTGGNVSGTMNFTDAFTSRTPTGNNASTTATGTNTSTTATGTNTNTASTGTNAGTALTVAQMPSHTHSVYDPGHNHYNRKYTGGSGVWRNFTEGGDGVNWSGTYPGIDTAYTGISLYANGSGSSHTHTFTGDAHTHVFNGTAHTHTFTGVAHTHAFTGDAMNFSVKYLDLIRCQKD